MSKEIQLIYQDCVRCGDRISWADKQFAVAKEEGFTIKRVPHTAIGAKGLIRQARLHGVQALAFFTDGKKFSTELVDFIPKKKADKAQGTDAELKTQSKTKQRVRAIMARNKKAVENGTEAEV